MSTPGESRRYKPSRAAALWTAFAALVASHGWLSVFGSVEPLAETFMALFVTCLVVYGFVYRYASWLNAARDLNEFYGGAR